MGNKLPTQGPGNRPAKSSENPPAADDQDLLQIRERLEWTPEERLTYLQDMLLFEDLAHTARRI